MMELDHITGLYVLTKKKEKKGRKKKGENEIPFWGKRTLFLFRTNRNKVSDFSEYKRENSIYSDEGYGNNTQRRNGDSIALICCHFQLGLTMSSLVKF